MRLTQRFTDFMHEDCRALGVLDPDVEPHATHYIEPIVSMVERLIENGAAYCGANGDVYYDVSSFPDYGALSDKRIEDLRSGARVEVDEAKDDPVDFVLWKASKPGEPSWESPWGRGRPGWHIECSVMSTACPRRSLRHPRRAGWTCSFPITRTRSRRARRRPAASS